MDSNHKKKPRIAFYMTTILEHGGGMENYLINTAHYLSKNLGVEADVITMDESITSRVSSLLSFYNFSKRNKAVIHNESTESIKKRLLPARYIQCSTFKELRSKLNEYDVIYSKNELLEAFIFKYIIRYGRVPPIVFGCHTPIFYPYTTSLQSKLHNFLYNGCAYRYLAKGVSGFQALNSSDFHRISLLFPNKSVALIPNPIDIDNLNANAHTYNFHAKFEKDKFNIVWIGRLTEQKGVDTLISVIEELNTSEYKDKIVWNICGDGQGRQKLEQLASKYDTNVRFFGHVENKYIPNLLMNSQLFLSTSKWEGHPISILEAQAMNLPVVAFKIPGPNDIIVNQETGLLVENISSIEQSIIAVLKGRHVFNNVSQTTKQRFQPRICYGNLLNFLLEKKKIRILALTTDPYEQIYGFAKVFIMLFDFIQKSNSNVDVQLFSNNGVSSALVNNKYFIRISIDQKSPNFTKLIRMTYQFVKAGYSQDAEKILIVNSELPELISAVILKTRFKKTFCFVHDLSRRNDSIISKLIQIVRIRLIKSIKNVITVNDITALALKASCNISNIGNPIF